MLNFEIHILKEIYEVNEYKTIIKKTSVFPPVAVSHLAIIVFVLSRAARPSGKSDEGKDNDYFVIILLLFCLLLFCYCLSCQEPQSQLENPMKDNDYFILDADQGDRIENKSQRVILIRATLLKVLLFLRRIVPTIDGAVRVGGWVSKGCCWSLSKIGFLIHISAICLSTHSTPRIPL